MAVYACSDLHGNGILWDKIKNYLRPADTLVFLGDAADRGKDGYRIIKEMLAEPQIVYLKGNHEDLMVNAAKEKFMGYSGSDCILWTYYNGGSSTMKDWVADGMPKDIINKLQNLPFLKVYHNNLNQTIYLLHAGCKYENLQILEEEDALWNRNHFYADWDGPDNVFIIHGHTIGDYLHEDVSAVRPASFFDITYPIIKYCDGHKFDIDCGTIVSNRTVLLNLDTWNIIEFKVGD